MLRVDRQGPVDVRPGLVELARAGVVVGEREVELERPVAQAFPRRVERGRTLRARVQAAAGDRGGDLVDRLARGVEPLLARDVGPDRAGGLRLAFPLDALAEGALGRVEDRG